MCVLTAKYGILRFPTAIYSLRLADCVPWGTEKKLKEPTGNITQKEKKEKSFEGFSYSEIPPIANLIK